VSDTLTSRPRSVRMSMVAAVGLLFIAGIMLPAVARAATFDPLNVIPYETFRAASSMSTADIQAFLSTQTGPLKSLVTADNSGKKKPASQIIYEAGRTWNLNPRVIIATLQKEQSLITLSNSSNASRLLKAMGCGIYAGSTQRYPGFGKQVYNGARVLSTYEITYSWVPGKSKKVTAYKSVTATKTVDGHVVTYKKTVPYSKTIVPKNASTFALYTYTPYYPQKSVWSIYDRFFGDPQAPPRMRPVYRFRSRANGSYYYTSSEAKRYTLIRTGSKGWVFEGTTLMVDTSATANATPLYDLYNTKTHRHTYTVSTSRRDWLLGVRPAQWSLSGVVGKVSLESSGTARVFQLRNRKTGGVLYTSSLATKRALSTGKPSPFFYLGVPFYLAASQPTTPPVGPAPSH
jgi:hypothetical protein